MIIKVKKRSIVIFTLLIILLPFIVPFVYAAFTGIVKDDFKVELVISNRNPAIKLANITSVAVDPIDGGTAQVLISFNATDGDGVGQINASKVIVNLTLGTPDGAQFRFNVSDQGGEFGTCSNHTESTTMVINCSVVMRYYDNTSSNWVINVSIEDTQGAVGRNSSTDTTTHTFTYNELSALQLPHAFVNFSNVNLGQQNVQAFPHLLLNNTGNDDFDQINITAAALVGTTTGSESIAVTNFAANSTNTTAGAGVALAASAVTLRELLQSGTDTLDNATLLHGPAISGDPAPYSGPTTTNGNKSIFFWVDVPSSGLSSQLYNASWNITVVDLP